MNRLQQFIFSINKKYRQCWSVLIHNLLNHQIIMPSTTRFIFLVKTLVPDSHDDVIMFIQRLVSVGVNLNGYRKAYKEDNEERHLLQSEWGTR